LAIWWIEEMSECIFCRIIAGSARAHKLYQDEQVTAFRDIFPRAPTHVLIVPNRHIVSVNDLTQEDEALVGRLFTIARQIAIDEGIDKTGYRLIVNTGKNSGQAVFHLHLHLLGGKHLRIPVG
jgi:histidine triad (HIT) family protein